MVKAHFSNIAAITETTLHWMITGQEKRQLTSLSFSFRNIKHRYYYRDKEKREIDVIIEKNGKLYPIEIKKTANPDKSMVKNFSIIPKDRLGTGAVLCLVKEDYPITADINAIPISYI